MTGYPIPKGPIRVEQKVKKSTFICYLAHCATRDEADEFIRSIKEKHPDANHNCWAYVAGAPSDPSGYAMNDDGEPKGCAGKPMFNVLHHSGIGEICAVVSRYFGGIKLGTGGMARAYSSSVQLALDALETTVKVHYQRFALTLPYHMQKTIEHLIGELDGIVRTTNYAAEIDMEVDINIEQDDEFIEKVREASLATVVCRRL